MSAVTAVIVTRLYLSMTGYPRLGSAGMHIAHLLWGGLLMLGALVLLLSMLGRRIRRVAAVVGGLGLGLFVDEIGKFVTADNDYFFQPAIAIIYVIFVVLFLVFRAIEHRSLSRQESLVNAADMVPDLILGGATRAEIARARFLLRRSGYHDGLSDSLREVVANASRAHEQPSRFNAVAVSSWRAYDRLLRWRWFHRAVWVGFVGQAVVGLLATAAIGWATFRGSTAGELPATLLSSSVSLAFVVFGVVELRRSRLNAYRWFERSVLISVFFTQVIMFWQDQLTALSGLIWDLVLLSVLRFLIRQELGRTVTDS